MSISVCFFSSILFIAADSFSANWSCSTAVTPWSCFKSKASSVNIVTFLDLENTPIVNELSNFVTCSGFFSPSVIKSSSACSSCVLSLLESSASFLLNNWKVSAFYKDSMFSSVTVFISVIKLYYPTFIFSS